MSNAFPVAFNPAVCFGDGWKAVTRYGTLPLVLGAVLHACTTPSINTQGSPKESMEDGISFGLGEFGENPLEAIRPLEPPNELVQSFMDELTIITVFAALFAAAIMLLINSWIAVGYLRTQAQTLETQSTRMATLFSGFDAFVPMILWQLLKYGIQLGVAAATFAPFALFFGGDWLLNGGGRGFIFIGLGVVCVALVVIYVSLGLALGSRYVAIYGCSPLEALERTWSAVAGNRISLLLFYSLATVCNILGFLTCCVGLLISMPMVDTGLTRGFLALEGQPYRAPTATK